jgi:phage/plasmid primase-like uncharacterized protein
MGGSGCKGRACTVNATFADAMRSAGLSPPDAIEPGRFHRFPGDGKVNGNTAGWAKLFDDGRGGVFGDFSTGLVESWQAEHPRPLRQSERKAFWRKVEESKAQAETKLKKEHEQAARIAAKRWHAATPARADHPYLVRKGVQAHGIRQDGDDLVIPMRDTSGKLCSLQFIAPDGSKKFLPGGRVRGCYYAIGNPDGTVCVAEGYATAATIHEATGCAVAAAFNAGNLEPVAVALRDKLHKKCEDELIVICADDDNRTIGNPGLTKATEAALAVGISARLAVPDFGNDRPDGATDFNDLAQHAGPEPIQRCIKAAKVIHPGDAYERESPAQSEENAIPHDGLGTDLTSDSTGRSGEDDARTDVDVARLRPLTVAELREQPSRPWLVYSLLQLLSLVVVWGATGSGKTFFVLDLAMALCRALRWFELRVCRGGVIYVAGEGHLPSRIAAYMQHHGLKDEDLARFRALPANINLLDPTADRAALIEALKLAAEEMGGVVLVVLDTLNAMMIGGDENSSEDMGAMIAAGRAIGSALRCTVVYVHHSGKNESLGLRGHSSLRAAVDTEISVSDKSGYRSVKLEKQRDGESGLELSFKLLPIDLGPSDDPEADEHERRTSCVVEEIASGDAAPTRQSKPPKGTAIALQALRDALSDHGSALPATSAVPPGTNGVVGDIWRKRYYLVDAIDADSDAEAGKEREARKKRFTRARTALLEAGTIGCVNDVYWIN